jgi:hypothetical protein
MDFHYYTEPRYSSLAQSYSVLLGRAEEREEREL